MQEFKKDNDTCVEVNIFVKCKDDCWKRTKEETCVKVNIFAECEERDGENRNPCD